MKLLKTWELLKLIDEDFESVDNKRFKFVETSSMNTVLGIGTTAIVSKCMRGNKGLFADGHILERLQGLETWEEVKIPVKFMEAFEAYYNQGEDIYCVIDNVKYDFKNNVNQKCDFGQELIARGKWYIVEEE